MKAALARNPRLAAAAAPLAARWQALAPRERRLVAIAGALVGIALVYLVLVQPALSTVRQAPARIDQLDAQLAQMRRLAAETRELRSATPIATPQSAAALQAATQRLGDKARVAVAGDRATATFTGVSGSELSSWLAEVRGTARVRPLEAQLTRNATGYSGTLVVALGGTP